MKKFLALCLCLLICLTGSARAAVQKQGFSAGAPHTHTVDFRRWFETMSATQGACTLSIDKSIYDAKKAQELMDLVSYAAWMLTDLTDAPLQEHTIYVVKDLFAGIQRFDNRIYCRMEDIESGDYLPFMISAALGIEEPWKAIALQWMMTSSSIDRESLAEFYREIGDLNMLSLFPAYFSEEFMPSDYCKVAQLTAFSLGEYILKNYGFSALMQENCDEFRQEWLTWLGLDRQYVDFYAGCFDGFRYTHDKTYPLIAISPKGDTFYLQAIYDVETPEQVRSLIHEAMSAPQELIDNLRVDEPEYADKLEENLKLSIKYYLEKDTGYSYAHWSLREVHLGSSTSVVHETMHILTRITNYSDRYYMDRWKAEGIAEYLTLKYRPSVGTLEEYFWCMDSKNLRISLFDTTEQRESKALLKTTRQLYLERAEQPQIPQDIDAMLYNEMMARAIQMNSMENSVSSVSDAFNGFNGTSATQRFINGMSYMEACSFSDYLIRNYSFKTFIDFCENNTAFEKVYNLSYEEAIAGWQAELMEK